MILGLSYAQMQINKKTEWVVPYGFHQARIVDARLIKECVNREAELKLLFEITSLVHPTRKYMARKVYKKGDSSQIITDLETILGDNLTSIINLAGEIIAEALVILFGHEVDVEIEHHHGKEHDKPYCIVTQITKPGVLVDKFKDVA